jgi:hypothetical protein
LSDANYCTLIGDWLHGLIPGIYKKCILLDYEETGENATPIAGHVEFNCEGKAPSLPPLAQYPVMEVPDCTECVNTQIQENGNIICKPQGNKIIQLAYGTKECWLLYNKQLTKE